MPNFSLKKTFLLIIGIIALAHLGHILRALGQIYNWFVESLNFTRSFPPGARAVIAYLTIIFVIVIVFKTINKNF